MRRKREPRLHERQVFRGRFQTVDGAHELWVDRGTHVTVTDDEGGWISGPEWKADQRLTLEIGDHALVTGDEIATVSVTAIRQVEWRDILTVALRAGTLETRNGPVFVMSAKGLR